MASPSETKTWETSFNNSVLADSTQGGNAFFSARKRLLGIKNLLTDSGTFSTPWIVTDSTNSVDAPVGSDQWDDEGDLVWRDDGTGAAARSWIRLKQAAISPTFEVLIICEEDSVNNDGKQISVWTSQIGFSGGSTTSNPSAADQRQIRHSTNFGYWGSGGVNVTYNSQTHVWMSSDGECTRVLITINSNVTGFWIFDVPKNPATGWTSPYFAAIQGTSDVTTNMCTYSLFYDSANALSYFGGQNVSLYFSGEGFGSAAAGEHLPGRGNQLNDDFSASDMGLHSLTSTFRGRQGEVFDLRWGFANSDDGMGRYFPDDTSKTSIQLGDMIFPWDGTTVMKTS